MPEPRCREWARRTGRVARGGLCRGWRARVRESVLRSMAGCASGRAFKFVINLRLTSVYTPTPLKKPVCTVLNEEGAVLYFRPRLLPLMLAVHGTGWAQEPICSLAYLPSRLPASYQEATEPLPPPPPPPPPAVAPSPSHSNPMASR